MSNKNTDDYVTLWRMKANDELHLFISGGATIDWGDGSTSTAEGDDTVKNTYFYAGDYEVRISNTLTGCLIVPSPSFSITDNLIDVKQWGSAKWHQLYRMFGNCHNMTMSTTDAPDLTHAINISHMFKNCTKFNSPLNHWQVRHISLMHNTFDGATSFNQDLSNWQHCGHNDNGVFNGVIRVTDSMFGRDKDLDYYLEQFEAKKDRDNMLDALK